MKALDTEKQPLIASTESIHYTDLLHEENEARELALAGYEAKNAPQESIRGLTAATVSTTSQGSCEVSPHTKKQALETILLNRLKISAERLSDNFWDYQFSTETNDDKNVLHPTALLANVRHYTPGYQLPDINLSETYTALSNTTEESKAHPPCLVFSYDNEVQFLNLDPKIPQNTILLQRILAEYYLTEFLLTYTPYQGHRGDLFNRVKSYLEQADGLTEQIQKTYEEALLAYCPKEFKTDKEKNTFAAAFHLLKCHFEEIKQKDHARLCEKLDKILENHMIPKGWDKLNNVKKLEHRFETRALLAFLFALDFAFAWGTPNIPTEKMGLPKYWGEREVFDGEYWLILIICTATAAAQAYKWYNLLQTERYHHLQDKLRCPILGEQEKEDIAKIEREGSVFALQTVCVGVFSSVFLAFASVEDTHLQPWVGACAVLGLAVVMGSINKLGNKDRSDKHHMKVAMLGAATAVTIWQVSENLSKIHGPMDTPVINAARMISLVFVVSLYMMNRGHSYAKTSVDKEKYLREHHKIKVP